MNIFEAIKNSIMEQYTPTYGEILENNKEKMYTNAIRNSCSNEEFEQYLEETNKLKSRLLQTEKQNTNQNNQKSFQQKQHNVNVCGIGEVTQVL